MTLTVRSTVAARRSGVAVRYGPGSPDGFGTEQRRRLQQIGLFETANGMPHGPVAIVLAILAAMLVLPVARLLRYVTRR